MPDSVRLAMPDDLDRLRTVERLPDDELRATVTRGRVLVATGAGDAIEGWLRWGLFWDEVPFMNLLFVLEPRRGSGLGRLLVEAWEDRARRAGHTLVLTSTQADEQAQHFYRHLGYVDTGCLLLPGEAAELVFRKSLT